MIGSFTHPLPKFRLSPLGIPTRKYIIIDLSAPQSSIIPRINNLIVSEDFSLHYPTALALIVALESESHHHFHVLLIQPNLWRFFSVCR